MLLDIYKISVCEEKKTENKLITVNLLYNEKWKLIINWYMI